MSSTNPTLQNFLVNGAFTPSNITGAGPNYTVIGNFDGSGTLNPSGIQWFSTNTANGNIFLDAVGHRYQITAGAGTTNPMTLTVLDIDTSGTPQFGTGMLYAPTTNLRYSLAATVTSLGVSEALQQAVRSRAIQEIDQDGTQKLAIPSYFYPGPLWTQLDSGAPTVGLAIINPNSGPGVASDPNYVTQTITSQNLGIIVIGYVFTNYGARAAATVKSDVDKYYTWYNVDGIFFDEVSTNPADIPYYTDLYNYVKAKPGLHKVVLNPGTNTDQGYINIADIIIIFEDTFSNYITYSPSAWVFNYPATKFWHLVHTTTNQQDLPYAMTVSKARNAYWIYVTPDVLPNPWDTLPTGSFWTDQLYLAKH